jgi:hypothetical protein
MKSVCEVTAWLVGWAVIVTLGTGMFLIAATAIWGVVVLCGR